MRGEELCQKYELTADQLEILVAKGMPRREVSGKWDYDTGEVWQWLSKDSEKSSSAVCVGPIARTYAECEMMLREAGCPVHERTLKKWAATYRDFPGRASAQGYKNGRFPINEIVEWISGNASKIDDGSGDVMGSPRSRLLIAKAEYAELLAKEKRGALIPKEDAISAVQRMFAMLDSFLSGIPDELASAVGGNEQGKVRERLADRVVKLRESLADQLEQEENLRGDGLKETSEAKE